ncbi:hypothetical protein COLO4_18574 [Corchorus olitorius]|uniref:Uncharacterized protein n=1 Tax=Corchorus olitorius TaxID=93759 RepID=A0A1R3J8K0_9ROSI|nr:hypothetical protein COLO4_18574 [Corchorus olitorius]
MVRCASGAASIFLSNLLKPRIPHVENIPCPPYPKAKLCSLIITLKTCPRRLHSGTLCKDYRQTKSVWKALRNVCSFLQPYTSNAEIFQKLSLKVYPFPDVEDKNQKNETEVVQKLSMNVPTKEGIKKKAEKDSGQKNEEKAEKDGRKKNEKKAE